MNLGATIKSCRRLRGLKLTALAERAHISISHLSLLEQDKRDPSLATVRAIADALNIPLSVLVFLSASTREVSDLNESQIDALARSVTELMDVAARQDNLF